MYKQDILPPVPDDNLLFLFPYHHFLSFFISLARFLLSWRTTSRVTNKSGGFGNERLHLRPLSLRTYLHLWRAPAPTPMLIWHRGLNNFPQSEVKFVASA